MSKYFQTSVFIFLIFFVFISNLETMGQSVAKFKMNWSLNDIHVRDPFILANEDDQMYYLYVQMGNNSSRPFSDKGVEVYRSKDLNKWDGPYAALELPGDFWATDKVWAPEVHKWHDQYYMFVTLTSSDTVVLRKNKMPLVHRATQIFQADSPRGPFKPINDTPSLGVKLMTLDGTLYIDRDDHPWMIYCHEWVQIDDGAVEMVRLSDDLSGIEGEPQVLFHASDAPWAKNIKETGSRYSGFITDGPYLYRTDKNKLIMIWSSMGQDKYAIGMAISESDDIYGPWKQLKKPLFSENGGHGMIFRDFSQNLYLTFHSPNTENMERTQIYHLKDHGTRLELGEKLKIQ